MRVTDRRMTDCRRRREVVNKPAVARSAPECRRSENIDRFVLVFMIVIGQEIPDRCPLTRRPIGLILRPKRRRAVQSIFHNLTRMKFRVNIGAEIIWRKGH